MVTLPSFEITASPTAVGYRTGKLTTTHGIIETPAFCPAAWEGVLPALGPEEAAQLGAPALMVSALQLALRPGIETVTADGDLRAFMGWSGPLVSDGGTWDLRRMSGLSTGQGRLIRVDAEGVTYASPLDGSRHELTPEQSLADQEGLGADLITALGAPEGSARSRRRHGDPTETTSQWVRRFLDSRTRPDQSVLGPVQLNATAVQTARALAQFPLDGFVLYENAADENASLLGEVLAELPTAKPRVLVSDRAPDAFFAAIQPGIDLLVTDEPVRLARRGVICVDGRLLDLGEPLQCAQSAESFGPIEADCRCPTCLDFSLAYLAHLFQAGELLANRLATLHNLAFTLGRFTQLRS